MVSVMWSEHCSYKSSRLLLRHLPTSGPRVVQGPGENAGVVDIGDGQVAVFKMESHNHPSFIEPYQGAATGVGGILRDVFTMGARPVACLDSLRFGAAGNPRTRYLLDGVVAGIAGYGNAFGVPTVGGDLAFDQSFDGNILVNVFALGLARRDRIFLGRAAGIGNPVIYVGAKTGRDGIHGATMASAEFDDQAEAKRPTVQVGDPFTEKLLLEACLELMKTDLLVGIQDMGAAGLTSSSVEMAARAGNGIEIDLARVPRRESGMTPYELMLSESQERMLLVTAAGREAEVLRIFEKWELDAAIVGRVTDSGRIVVRDGDAGVVADLPIEPLAEGLRYQRPGQRPAWQDELGSLELAALPPPQGLAEAALAVLGSPAVASKEWVYRQYDHQVRDGTVVCPGSDAAVIRVPVTDGAGRAAGEPAKGLALSVDCQNRFCYLDPYQGARLTVVEAASNLVASGAQPLAVTDCLNFGNPEKPEIMWQFAEAVRGLADACRDLATPIVSGNVSFYNETDGRPIFPSPTVAMVGLVADLARHLTQCFKGEGDLIALLGATDPWDLGGSEYLKVVHGRVAGRPPGLDMSLARAVQRACLEAAQRGLLRSAHDLSEGGLLVALAESCVSGSRQIGAEIDAVQLQRHTGSDDAAAAPPWAWCFSESPARILVSLSERDLEPLAALAAACQAPFAVLGRTGGRVLRLRLDATGADLVLPLDQLASVWRDGLRQVAG
jgi:phosphoribosylformylglycinamidine synthase